MGTVASTNLAVIGGSAAIVGSLVVLWWTVAGTRRPDTVDLTTAGSLDPDERDLRRLMLRQSAADRVVVPQARRLGALLLRITPAKRVATLSRKLSRAGSPAGWTVERVLALKALLAVVLGTAGLMPFLFAHKAAQLLLVALGVFIGWFLPDGVLDSRVSSRQEAIRGQVADTIDQLAVMVRAGLGIDAALVRTARAGKGELAEEFARVVQDMRIGVDRTVALASMAERTDVPELRGFVAALAQAEKLGVPVSDTLRVQSAELRVRRRQFAEEAAMKLPVKILFPMVFCILPVIFIALLGPAAIRIFDLFK